MTAPRPFDPIVLKFFSVMIQRILLAVAKGCAFWISGEVAFDRALVLAEKFNTRFGCNLTRSQRSARAKKGVANFRLCFIPREGTRVLDWVLLMTPGTHPQRDSERWNAVGGNGTRLAIRGYELVHLDRSREHREHLANQGYTVKPRHWTWRLTKEEYQGWCDRFEQAIVLMKRQNNKPMEEALGALTKLTHTPGVGKQIDKIKWYVRQECERQRLPVPAFPPEFYSRFRKSDGSPLSELVARAARGEPSWF